MPAKCVVFSGIRKHDGRSFRDILPGEYTQMAGRAGRRGLDPTGTVIIIAHDSLPEQTTLHTMMLGTPGKLSSQFRLTYNMILNLLRVEALKVEEMIKRSFSENASQRLLPEQQKKVIEATAILLKPAPLQGLESGLLEKLKTYYVLALVDPETKSGAHDIDNQAIPPYWPPTPESLVVDDGVYELRAVPLTSVALVTSRSVKVEVDNIVERHLISRMKDGITALQVLVDEWNVSGEIPEHEWDRMRALDFQELLQSRISIIQKLSTRSCTLCGDFIDHYAVIHGEKVLRANIGLLKLAISDQNLELIPDYEQRVAVLQELKFIDENSTVLLKGRVACEINSANELVLTELILENTLAGYEPEEVVALLSCFVFQEKTEVEPVIPPKLEAGRDAILAINDRVGRIQDYHKVSVEEFRSNLNFGLTEVVYEWAKGMPFQQITSLTDVAEGTIVRVITRLDETCREVRDAARVIGDAELFKKMEEAQIKIKRDSLRVAKEDRHTNLTRGRLAKALARQEMEKALQLQQGITDGNNDIRDNTDSSAETSATVENSTTRTGDASESQVTEPQPVPTIKPPTRKRKRILYSPEQIAASRNAKVVASERITELNLGFKRSLSSEGTCTHAVIKERRQVAPVSPPIESPPPRTPSPCPTFAPLENFLNILDDEIFYSGLRTPSDFYLGLCDDAVDSSADMPFNNWQQSSPTVTGEHRPLSHVERQELYHFINDNIASSHGIVEKAGSYCAYMTEHIQHSRVFRTSINYGHLKGLQSGFETQLADEGEVDFRNWLCGYDAPDLDQDSRTDLYYPSDEHLVPQEGKGIPTSVPQIDFVANNLVTNDTHFTSSRPDNLEPSPTGSTSPYPRLNYDYAVDLRAGATQPALPNTPVDRASLRTIHFSSSHRKRHLKPRILPTSQGQALRESSNYHTSPALQWSINNPLPSNIGSWNPGENGDQLFLHVLRPARARARTTSARTGYDSSILVNSTLASCGAIAPQDGTVG
ncbi:hypothetical protein H0H87_006458 [Tephrocybe sp. NHM501043]|nr:hypothetical protein H0H87_006458 [Tephrocybe sp. NHM501043]